jgi:predicted Zn-dependent protease
MLQPMRLPLPAPPALRAVRAANAACAASPAGPARGRRLQRTLAALLALAFALPLPAAAQVRLPALGEAAHQDLSVADEKRIGESIMREGRRDPTFLDDPVLQDYLQALWAPLVAAARQRGDIEPDTDRYFSWEIFLLSERSVNAFALPGGFVGVHLGLIGITNTPDQLASVLAHELTHVTQRHIARSIAPGQRASMAGMAALLLSILAATRGASADVVNAGIAGGQAAAIQGQLNFSRDMEREADRIGFGVMGTAGYAQGGMAEMFERLDAANRLNDTGNFPYLRSHPLTIDRIAEARSRTLVPGRDAGTASASPRLAHALMQARARVLMDTSVQGLQRLLSGASTSQAVPDKLAATYAAAMAAGMLRDAARIDRALPQLDDALRQAAAATPREPLAERALALLKTDLLLARGDGEAATRALAAAPTVVQLGSSARPVLLLRAQSTLQWHRQQPQAAAAELRRTTEDLQTWVANQPQDGAAWEQLAATSDALGLKLRSLRAGAEARAAVGDMVGAIDRLRAAQSSARTVQGQDFIEASVIDARLRQLMAERRQLVIESRGGSSRSRPDGDEPPPLPPQGAPPLR